MRSPLLWLGLVAFISTPACKSAEEKAAEEARRKAGEELRKKANLSLDEHEVNCGKDDAMGCAALATAYQIGEEREANPQKAQELFEKACTLGHPQSCIDAATTYLDDEKWSEAAVYLKMGCSANSDDACTRLAQVEQELDRGKAEGEAGEAGEAKDDDGAELSEAERLMKEIENAEQDED